MGSCGSKLNQLSTNTQACRGWILKMRVFSQPTIHYQAMNMRGEAGLDADGRETRRMCRLCEGFGIANEYG